MAWYWSDDVASAAIEAGLVPERALFEWLNQPSAFAMEEGLSLIDAARRLLAPEDGQVVGAA
jgi:hypothetical protein